MINTYDVLETIRMIQDDCLDIRTITMGISLLDCIDSDINVACENVYKKITAKAARLVEVGEQIEKELGIPISSESPESPKSPEEQTEPDDGSEPREDI